MCTAENDDKFVVDLEQGVRTVGGLFKIEIDGSFLVGVPWLSHLKNISRAKTPFLPVILEQTYSKLFLI